MPIKNSDRFSDTSRGYVLTDKVGPKAYDLAGHKFGMLHVKRVFSYRKSPQTGHTKTYYWVALCDCGTEVIVNGNYMTKKASTKSCGCLAHEAHNRRTEELNYAKVGRWGLPVKLAAAYAHKMRSFKDLRGQEFNHLKVLDVAYVMRYTGGRGGRTVRKHLVFWECLCRCGKKTVRPAPKLLYRKGIYQSCGCQANR